MTFFEIWSEVGCGVTKNMLTKEEARIAMRTASPGSYIREMDPELVDAIQATGLNTCECG